MLPASTATVGAADLPGAPRDRVRARTVMRPPLPSERTGLAPDPCLLPFLDAVVDLLTEVVLRDMKERTGTGGRRPKSSFVPPDRFPTR